ncbi:MAG: hypothetical protein ACYCU8_00460 [Ferrimicrobium acidiphilum]
MAMDMAAADEAMARINEMTHRIESNPSWINSLRHVGTAYSLQDLHNETVVGWYRDRLSLVAAVVKDDGDKAYAARPLSGEALRIAKEFG